MRYACSMCLNDHLERLSKPHLQREASMQNLSKQKLTGELSKQALKDLRNKISWLLFISDQKTFFDKQRKKNISFKNNMITLTLSDIQIHTDNFIKSKMLDVFLQWLRDRNKKVNYVWRAETQRNGNIHFHIVTDQFYHYLDVRQRWNAIQSRYGYTENYAIKHWSHNPNSTDVHRLKGIKNTEAYLTKYMSKSLCSDNLGLKIYTRMSGKNLIWKYILDPAGKVNHRHERLITGRLWGCSQLLSSINNIRVLVNDQLSSVIDQAIKKQLVTLVHDDHYSLFFNNPVAQFSYLDNHFKKWFGAVRQQIKLGNEYVLNNYLDPYDFKFEKTVFEASNCEFVSLGKAPF